MDKVKVLQKVANTKYEMLYKTAAGAWGGRWNPYNWPAWITGDLAREEHQERLEEANRRGREKYEKDKLNDYSARLAQLEDWNRREVGTPNERRQLVEDRVRDLDAKGGNNNMNAARRQWEREQRARRVGLPPMPYRSAYPQNQRRDIDSTIDGVSDTSGTLKNYGPYAPQYPAVPANPSPSYEYGEGGPYYPIPQQPPRRRTSYSGYVDWKKVPGRQPIPHF